jgi:cytochrome b
MSAPKRPSTRILVWDLPTRVFHWLFAVAFVGAYATGDSERWRDVHLLCGYSMLVLVAFRIVWGLAGTRYARFAAWPWSPRRALWYLASLLGARPERTVGHNPAGSLAIYALLGTALLAAASGLATFNEVGGEWVEEVHDLAGNAMLVLVCIHLAGVLVGSLAHRENLPWTMVSGRKRGAPAEGIRGARPIVAALLVGVMLAVWTGALRLPGIDASLTSVTTHSAASAQHRKLDDDD